MSDTKPLECECYNWMIKHEGDSKKFIEYSAYDSLKRELDAAQESERFYRREFELACERYNYAKEELEAVKADFANTRFMFSKEQEWRVKTEAERDELKELVREAEYYMTNEGEGLWLERAQKALGENK